MPELDELSRVIGNIETSIKGLEESQKEHRREWKEAHEQMEKDIKGISDYITKHKMAVAGITMVVIVSWELLKEKAKKLLGLG